MSKLGTILERDSFKAGGFDTLAFELIADILLCTNLPRDIAAISQCNKYFCGVLVHPTCDYIWRRVEGITVTTTGSNDHLYRASYVAFLLRGCTTIDLIVLDNVDMVGSTCCILHLECELGYI